MSHNAVFRWGCFVNASLVVSLLASGCTSRVDLAEERASNSSAAGAPADVNGTGGVGAGSSAGGSGNVGSGGTGNATSADAALEFSCPSYCESFVLLARTDAAGTPVQVDPGTETWWCDGYHLSSVQAHPGQIVAFSPIIDNSQMLYEFSLIKTSTPQQNGTSTACYDAPPQGERVYHWAPGTGSVVLPAGSEIPLDTWDFVLDLHYINVTAQPLRDTSGVSVCAC